MQFSKRRLKMVRIPAVKAKTNTFSTFRVNNNRLIRRKLVIMQQILLLQIEDVRLLGFHSTSFLFTEYQYVGVIMVIFAVLIFVFLGFVPLRDSAQVVKHAHTTPPRCASPL
uniref:Uncharacterized protein n=1 Tax=Helianthus annuus TaxID=4232 RepID=A0A251V0F1_HELAN